MESTSGDRVDDVELTMDIMQMIEDLPPSPRKCCIYKVPVSLRSVNEAAYTPKIVSLGPLHHGDEKMQLMEVYKKRFLNAFLWRNVDNSLEDYVKLLKELEEQARNSYFDEQFICCLSSDEFVKMLLFDGCFIVEFLLLDRDIRTRNKNVPVLKNVHYRSLIYNYDMLLLENQLPFFVIEALYDLMNGPEKRCMRYSFFELTIFHFSDHTNMERALQLRISEYQIKHFLDYMLKCYSPSEIPSHPYQELETREDRITLHVPSATELHLSGIMFKKGNSNGLLDIKFLNGVLEIPSLLVQDSTECRFSNMVAMEQCHEESTSYITDYLALMEFLLKTPDDVALLRSCSIIENSLGSDKEVSQLFSKLGRGVLRNFSKSYYYQLLEDLNTYHKTPWTAWKVKLKMDYFNSSWPILCLNAAIVLLSFLLIQAVCSVISVNN